MQRNNSINTIIHVDTIWLSFGLKNRKQSKFMSLQTTINAHKLAFLQQQNDTRHILQRSATNKRYWRWSMMVREYVMIYSVIIICKNMHLKVLSISNCRLKNR